jgi:hypothetical protein
MRIPGPPSLCVRSALLLVSLAGCSRSAPGVLVGESEHFRLFVDPDLDTTSTPATMMGSAGLASLETDWADKQTMLHMPTGRKVDYQLLTAEHVASVCGLPERLDGLAGCEVANQLMVVGVYLPYQHELIHAYMNLLAPGVFPVPLLVEGTAQGIGCDEDWTSVSYSVPWQEAVLATAQDNSDYAYEHGAKLVRYLIRTQGSDAFVRYYRQAPQRRDPSLFAANFLAFWGMTIDDVWAAMHVDSPGSDNFEQKICPCSLPALPVGGAPIPADVTTHPYWTVSGAPGASLALSAAQGLADIKDCQGVLPDLQSHDAGVASVFQLPADDRLRYLLAPVAAASADAYVSDTCDGAAPYPLPVGLIGDGGASLNISLVQQTVESQTYYLQIQLSAPAKVPFSQVLQACRTCDFTQPPCAPPPNLDAGSAVEVLNVPAGAVFLKITLPALPADMSTPFETSTQVFFQ